jgi:23S rRNA pseudoU1915 N3-methylase RlmH
MASTLSSGFSIEHIHIDGEVKLPKKDSKLAQCLGALASLKEASTQEVAKELTKRGESWCSDEVASFLTILKHRGLVVIVVPGKGVLGGSRWSLTATARRLLKL